MANLNAAFVGSVPENYDRYLGPIYFHHYADDLVARVPVAPGMRVLEVACGTGIVTERLVRRLGGNGSIVATDLNDAMFAYARRRGVAAPGLEWRQADATKLPFDEASFDVVVCEFGLMFFPDKIAGLREAFRVLKAGGTYVLNTWDSLERNLIAKITHETVASFFPQNPPQFYTVPFSLHDTAVISAWLAGVGFATVTCETVAKIGTSPSAAAAATGLIEGNPIYGEIMTRRPEALDDIKHALARNLAAQLGDRPLRCHLRAHVFSAEKPRA